MSIPILLVVLEIWSTRSSPWTPSCSWQSSPWRPPPTRPLAACYRCHYTQWSPQKDGIKIRALVVELLHLKDRQLFLHTDIQTDRQTLAFIGRALLRNVPFKNQRGIIHTQTNLWVIYNFHSPLSSCSIIENYSIHLSPGCLWVLGWVIPVACVCNVCVMIYTHFKLYLFTNCILCANAAPISQCTLYTWWIYIYSTGSVPYAIVWREPITCTYVPM